MLKNLVLLLLKRFILKVIITARTCIYYWCCFMLCPLFMLNQCLLCKHANAMHALHWTCFNTNRFARFCFAKAFVFIPNRSCSCKPKQTKKQPYGPKKRPAFLCGGCLFTAVALGPWPIEAENVEIIDQTRWHGICFFKPKPKDTEFGK